MLTESKGWKPSVVQENLIKAATLKNSAAVDSWNQWKQNITLESIDFSSARILPLLYTNLHEKISDPWMDRYKGLVRRAWYRNNMLLNEAGQVSNLLEENGFKSVLVKGGNLLISTYENIGTRPMGDVDLWISFNEKENILALLKQNGWSYRYSLNKIWHPNLDFIHAVPLIKNNMTIDLHLKPIWCSGNPLFDTSLWTNTSSVPYKNYNFQTANPTDNLLLTCVHGACWGISDYYWAKERDFQWIVDVHKILQIHQIDWDRLVHNSLLLDAHGQIKKAFAYLKANFYLPIPDKTLASLNDSALTRWSNVHTTLTVAQLERKKTLFSWLWEKYLVWLWKRKGALHVNKTSLFSLVAGLLVFIPDRLLKGLFMKGWTQKQLYRLP